MKTKIPISDLRPTEEVIPMRLLQVEKALGLDTELWPPILVNEEYFILDGHHRHAIAMKHNFFDLSAIFVSYADESVLVVDYNDGTEMDKQTLLRIYRTGVVLKAKTTRHLIIS